MTLIVRRRTTRLTALFAVPALLLALSACGTETTSRSPSAGSSAGAPSTREAWTLSFNQCLRDHGIAIDDPAPGAPVTTDAAPAPGEVIDACTEQVGNPPPLSAEEQDKIDQEGQKQLLTMAKCYRENGVEVPDPNPGEALALPQDVPPSVVETCGGGMAPGGLVDAG